MTKLSLTKSEKNLLYILTLLLIAFVYINFFRADLSQSTDDIKSELENLETQRVELAKLIEEKEKLEANIDEISKRNNTISTMHKSFGSSANILSEWENFGANISNYTISRPFNAQINDVPVTKMDTTLVAEMDINMLPDILKSLNSYEYLVKDKMKLIRTGKERVQLSLILSEMTLEQVPYTGITYNSNESKIDESPGSLLDELYGKKESEVVKSTAVSNTSEKVKIIKPVEGSAIESDSNLKDTNFNKSDNLTEGVINYATYFGAIDENNRKAIDSSHLKNYSNEYNIEMVFDSKYFNENKDLLKDNYEFTRSFQMNNYTGETNIEISRELDLSNTSISIDRPNDYYALEFKVPNSSIVEIELVSKNGNLINVESGISDGQWNTFIFELPQDSSLYPIEINGISIKGSGGEDNGTIKNFATLKKKQ